MNVGILKALMELFAIITYGDGEREEDSVSRAREVVSLFLRQQFNPAMTREYLELFNTFLEDLYNRKKKKGGGANAVRLLKISARVNSELSHKDKLIVVMRLFEYLEAVGQNDTQRTEFVFQTADTLNISKTTADELQQLTAHRSHEVFESEKFVFLTGPREGGPLKGNVIEAKEFKGLILFYLIEGENLFFLKYIGDESLQMNGQPLRPDWCQVFSEGSNIRGGKLNSVYFSEVMQRLKSKSIKEEINFTVDNITYFFKRGNKQALHQLSFAEKSGSLVGIMGGSGSGKSTLLNVLNGNLKPAQGTVAINGLDIHDPKNDLRGLIGFVAQDDLLIEELTVFQNLYYNAKLSFGGSSEEEVIQRVNETLRSLGLYEARDLKVGSPLDKTISGGQRKRVNIALELIREPAVLFVDEPTSGLSSGDSENIMDLLKELTLRGKLVFVVIHQPSSDIFKMFDKLLVMDQGGYPVFYGHSVESIEYFRKLINHVNHEECQCPACGNVNPEQLFNIIEAKMVDEYGHLTEERRISPKEWNDFYNVLIGNNVRIQSSPTALPPASYRIPSLFSQFRVFFVRDILSKLTNRQYVLINLLEAPALGFILSFFLKYYILNDQKEIVYSFQYNPNIPQYLFISVIVALFLGLTVSAEEIFRDQKILKREKFLSLSRGSYLWSKISIMFLISAIQMALYVLVGNSILEIKGMNGFFWAALFSTSCFANLLGLNISASFNSAKVIYILVPILIIPQLLFSGVIVKFDRLHYWFADNSKVPALGNVMASRWAYEAMAVHQFIFSEYGKVMYEVEKDENESDYIFNNYFYSSAKNRIELRINELAAEAGAYGILNPGNRKVKALVRDFDWLISRGEAQIKRILDRGDVLSPDKKHKVLHEFVDTKRYAMANPLDGGLTIENMRKLQVSLNSVFVDLKSHQKQMADDAKNAKVKGTELESKHSNDELRAFVTGSRTRYEDTSTDKSIFSGTGVNYHHVYVTPKPSMFMSAHFYAPVKHLFMKEMWTSWANLIVIWLMTLFLGIVLYFDGLKKILDTRISLPFGKKAA